MKTCPNCATSLPDFVNTCTKCKFNLSSSAPPKPPISPTPSAQISSPPSRITSASISGQTNQDRVSSPAETGAREESSPKKKKFAIYAVGGIVVLAVLGWLGSGKPNSEGDKPIKEKSVGESAKSKPAQSAPKPAAPDVNQIMRDAANKPANNATPNRAKDVRNADGANANKPWYQQ